jgi:hypothetical protein
MSTQPQDGGTARERAAPKASPFPGAVEIDARLKCPDCGETAVKLYVKASTTVGFTCANRRCKSFEVPRPPEDLSG